MTMCDSNSVQFVRIYNQAPLKQMCASVLKQHYISNVHRTLDKYFPKEFTASEMSYLTCHSKEKLIQVMLYALSMSSSTFLKFSPDVMGKYDSSVFICEGGGSRSPLHVFRFFLVLGHLYSNIHNYYKCYAALNQIIKKNNDKYALK